MKKKIKKVSTKTVLPEDFSSSDVPSPTPKESTAVVDTIPQTETPSTPLAVPQIDKDATLKIEEADLSTEELPESEKSGMVLFILGTISGILIIAATVFLAFLYFKTPSTTDTVSQTTTTPSPTPTETPKVVISNADITFEILNGSGISGQAAKYGKQVEALGYKVGKLGNAEGTNTGISLYLSSKLDSQKDDLLSNLKKEFSTITYAGVLSDSDNLVRIIIGK